MPTIDLIALDLDGTLLDSNEQISPANRSAIARALSEGVRVVLITGRGAETPMAIARELQLDLPVICAHGALTIDANSSRVLEHTPIGQPAARELLSFAEGRRLTAAAYIDQRFHRLTGTRAYMQDQQGPSWRDIATFDALALDNVTFIRFLGHDAAQAALPLAARLAVHAKYERWGDFEELALTATDASKLRALQSLCAKLDVAAESVLAIGDSRNDVPMMRWAGAGVAMGNADEQVRSDVAYVTDSNDDDGVAAAIDRFVFDTEREKKSA